MHRFLRILAIFLGVLLLLAALSAGYLLTGASDAQTRIQYTLRLPEPPAGAVSVSITLQPGPTPFIDLYLREPVQEGRQRITGLKVERAGAPLPHWQTLPFFADALRLWNGFSTEPVTITYQVDPLWMKGPESPRSYLGPDFAYLRGMVTLYTPLSLNDILHPGFEQLDLNAGFAEMDVQLPAGWQMVSPFGAAHIATPAAHLRNAYFGFGPFAVQDLLFANTPFLLGVYEGLPAERQAELSQQIPLLFQTLQKQAGFAPVSHTCYWSLAILPAEPIHGGASGTGSLVVEDDLSVIAHEMFHWWNGATLATTPDANWIKEGFTMYYAAKSLRDSGLWTQADFEREMRRFEVKLWGRSDPQPLNLVEASNRLVQKGDSQAYNPVYYGGGLLAYSLDQRLQAQGSSLDALWPVLYQPVRPTSTADFLRVLEEQGGPELANETRAFLEGKTPALPGH